MELDMTKGKPMGLMLRFLIPVAIGNIFQQLYNTVDSIIVGRFVGVGALAAVGSTGTIMFLILGFLSGLTSGFTVLVSQRFGAGDIKGMKRAVGNAALLAVIVSAVMTFFSMVFMKQLLTLMNTPADIYQDAYDYIIVICGGICCNVLYNMMAAVLRAVGNSKVPLYFLILSAMLNIVLDPLFIYGPSGLGKTHLMYAIANVLRRTHPELNLEVIIGSVRDAVRLNHVMETYRPELVFHAAAHKHVPLMEESPNEAIKNNVIGTYKLAKAAAEYGVKRFVQISTDKAVNPTNIMGASKRLCEMVIQMMNRESKTEFVAVRFGNVLGSNGSVIPLFKKQIEAGGPVTVTHPDIIRYFMTIPEAVSLVLQAGYYAKGGEIFILDMGEPVKIDTMARNMIRLSGYEPDVDIKIEYTGLRPGEKLYEELLMKEEGMQETANKLIHIGKPIEMDDALLEQQLKRLDEASRAESEDIKDIVAEIVPTYKRECKV